jgi:quercetin dioxygenase-like cupin family protein
MSERIARQLPDEAAIRAAFARERLRPHVWSSAPGELFAEHAHAYHKVLYCLRGSITFTIVVTGERLALVPGDRLDVPPQARHTAIAGADGVTCIEAARGEE